MRRAWSRRRTSGGRPPRCRRAGVASSRRPGPGRRSRTRPRGTPAVLDRLERPEAMDHPDLEPVAQERSVATAPCRRTRAAARACGRRRRGRSRGATRRRPPGRRMRADLRQLGRGRRRGTTIQQPTTTSMEPSDVGDRSGHRPAGHDPGPEFLELGGADPVRGASTRYTSRPATGPSVSSARGILASTSRAQPKPPRQSRVKLDRVGRPRGRQYRVALTRDGGRTRCVGRARSPRRRRARPTIRRPRSPRRARSARAVHRRPPRRDGARAGPARPRRSATTSARLVVPPFDGDRSAVGGDDDRAPGAQRRLRRRRPTSSRTKARSAPSQRDSSHGNAPRQSGSLPPAMPDLVAVVEARAPRAGSAGAASRGERRSRSPPRIVRSRGVSCEPRRLSWTATMSGSYAASSSPEPRRERRSVDGADVGAVLAMRRRRSPCRGGRHRRTRGSPRPAGSPSARRSDRRGATRGRRARSRRPGTRRAGWRDSGDRNSSQNPVSRISSGTSSRQPSMPNRSQCSATVNRYSRTAGSPVLSLGSDGIPHQAA